MCLLLLGRTVPCKTGCVKNVCLSQVQYSQSSQVPLLWLAFQNKPAVVFRDRDIVLLIRPLFRHGALSGTGLIAVLGSSFSQLTD